MADKIRLLPEVVANQIAAGEVVNRPSSVVKEMMENAIDAGAASVKVNFRDGGRELIQIVDDGCGMSPIDARMAFDRHATSKIRDVEDIYALHTFGFRGEALASIAAVAQVELRTRQADDEMGTQTEINGGQFAGQRPVMCPVGSQFFVRNLFYNVPARRRFLDKSTTSAAQIKSEFQRVALCNPQIAFELYANDAPVYSLPASSLAGRIVDVVGRHIKQNLLEVGAETSIASIAGFIGRPAAAKKRNTEQYLFVNGRYFKSTYLTSAVMKAYEKLIPVNAQPSYFLYLNIDPGRIDVNVHPQKTEVKFADEEAVWQIVHAAVRETLAKTGAVPLMDFDSEGQVDIPVLQRGVVYNEPKAMSNNDYNPFREEYIDPSAPDPNVDFTGFDVPWSDPAEAWEAGASPMPPLRRCGPRRCRRRSVRWIRLRCPVSRLSVRLRRGAALSVTVRRSTTSLRMLRSTAAACPFRRAVRSSPTSYRAVSSARVRSISSLRMMRSARRVALRSVRIRSFPTPCRWEEGFLRRCSTAVSSLWTFAGPGSGSSMRSTSAWPAVRRP